MLLRFTPKAPAHLPLAHGDPDINERVPVFVGSQLLRPRWLHVSMSGTVEAHRSELALAHA